MSTVRLTGGTSAVDRAEEGRSLAACRPPVGLLLAGILAIVVALSTETSVASHPDGASPGLPPGISEAELREAETAILGPAHAAEHAQQRAAARQQAEPSGTSAADDGSPQPRVVGPPAEVGQWGAPFRDPHVGIHAVLLPTGKVMWWSNIGTDGNTAQAWLWDPSAGTTKRVDPPILAATGKPANIWCGGQSLLPDGRLLVTGGNLAYPDDPPVTPAWKGLNKVYTFNPFNETWTEQPDMPHGRWYPGQVNLPDGRTMIISGLGETGSGQQNPDVDLFTPSADLNGQGTLTTIATRGGAGQPPPGGLYPHMVVMRSGRTLVAGPEPQDSWFVDQISPFSWSQVADFAGGGTGGRAVGSWCRAAPAGPVIAMLIGGGRPAAVGTSVRIDESSPSSGAPALPADPPDAPQHGAAPGRLDGDGRWRRRRAVPRVDCGRPTRSRSRSSSTTRRHRPGGSAPPSRRAAPTIPPPCCSPMAGCCPPGTRSTAPASTQPRSMSRRICSRDRDRRSPRPPTASLGETTSASTARTRSRERC